MVMLVLSLSSVVPRWLSRNIGREEIEMHKPDLNRDRILRTAPHEILLSFNADMDAAMFDLWWEKRGWKAFEEWEKSQRELDDMGIE
jgi:hypothetical protein